MPRFNSVSFYQNRPKIKFLISPKFLNWRSNLNLYYWQQGCRSLLSIGGGLQFYPNFALFSTLWRWTSTMILFKWANQVKTKKKVFTKNGTLFFPEFRWRLKKKVFTKNGTHFFPRIQVKTCAQMHTGVKFLEGMQMKTILKLFGGYSQIIGGIYSPIPPGFRHPWLTVMVTVF